MQRARRDADHAGADGGRVVARGAVRAGRYAVPRRAQPRRHHAALPRLLAAGTAARASLADTPIPRY